MNQSTPITFVQPDNGNAGGKWGGDSNISRDRYGRPLVTPPDGGPAEPYTRATTFVDALSDKSSLMKWSARMSALGLAQRDDLLLKLAGHDPGDTRGIDQIVDAAAEAAGSKRKADIGTALHEATERYDLGQEPRHMGKFQPDVDAYIAATQGIEWVEVESFRIQDDLKIGGTADRIGKMGNELFIADIKTGGLWDIGKFAAQLAVYARSVPYDTATGKRGADPLPMNVNQGLLIHLPAGEGKADLYWLNLQVGWEAALLCGRVREWRKFSKNKGTRDQVMVPVSSEEAAAMGGRK